MDMNSRFPFNEAPETLSHPEAIIAHNTNCERKNADWESIWIMIRELEQ
jgi:hypothetical protein